MPKAAQRLATIFAQGKKPGGVPIQVEPGRNSYPEYLSIYPEYPAVVDV
jgi:hypothetical protein